MPFSLGYEITPVIENRRHSPECFLCLAVAPVRSLLRDHPEKRRHAETNKRSEGGLVFWGGHAGAKPRRDGGG